MKKTEMETQIQEMTVVKNEIKKIQLKEYHTVEFLKKKASGDNVIFVLPQAL